MNSCMEPPKRHSAGYAGQSLLEAHLTLVASPLQALEQLIKKFAPIVYFHEDGFTPMAVEEYLQKSCLVNGPAKSRVPATPAAMAALSWSNSGFYLEPKEGGGLPGAKAAIKTYVHVKEVDNTHTDLQYWFFYAQTAKVSATLKWLIDGTIKGYEGMLDLDPLGVLNGCWQRITVRIHNATQEAEQVYFSGISSWLGIGQLQRRGSQVLAYASKSKGSFYPAAESYLNEKVKFNLYSSQLEFCLQQETGSGKELDFSVACELISAGHLGGDKPAEPLWLNFRGHWGPPSPDYLAVPLVKRLVLSTFGKPLEFLLSGDILGELVNYLRQHFSKECHHASLGPRERACWEGGETEN